MASIRPASGDATDKSVAAAGDTAADMAAANSTMLAAAAYIGECAAVV